MKPSAIRPISNSSLNLISGPIPYFITLFLPYILWDCPMHFLAYRLLISISLLSLLGCANALNSDVNFTSLCEEVRERILEEGIHNKSNNLGQLNCGAKFSEDTLPSLSIPISLTYCLARAAGYQRSRVLSEWATPLFGFMLPALIFTLTVKRRSQFVNYTRLLKTESSTEKSSSHYQRAKEVFWDIMILIWVLFISVISASVDAVVWAVTVFVLAGPLIAGTVHEAVLDFFMLQRLEQNITHLSAPRLGSSASSSESLVSSPSGYDPEAAMSGRFNSEAAPGDIVDRTLNDPIKKLRRLLKEAQPFGDIIVGPVVFFLGAFVWSLFDARERKGDNDTANAVAFGIWYGVVVLVATVFAATIGVTHHLTGEKVGPVDTESDDETGLKKAPRHRLIHNYLKKWKKNAIFIVTYHDAELSSYITDLQLWTSRVFALAATVTFVIFPCILASAICYWTPTVRKLSQNLCNCKRADI